MLSRPSATLSETFPHICIVGVGLIGGSVAAGLRAGGYTGHLTGYDVRPLQPLVERRLLDCAEESFSQGAICPADLVYLAGPISSIIDFLRTKGGLLKPGALLTDAGSTKRAIVGAAAALPEHVTFVGGHPMAGSERSGAEYAEAHLFTGTTYLLTPVDEKSAQAAAALELLIQILGARPLVVSPGDHDRMVALVSQVPQLLATVLAAEAGDNPARDTLFGLAGNGYRDMTRLAASHWDVWGDICRTNADNIAAGLAQLTGSLSAVRQALTADDGAALEEVFRQANEAARQLRETKVKLFSR